MSEILYVYQTSEGPRHSKKRLLSHECEKLGISHIGYLIDGKYKSNQSLIDKRRQTLDKVGRELGIQL